MKKLLALVMAMVMTLGLATVSASAKKADYPDADQILYAEAVDVLTEIGILGGNGNGFAPKDELTRAEAAKIVSFLMAEGKDVKEQITVTSSRYTDVPVGEWYTPYIEYLSGLGVVGGIGDNKFDPTGKLTTAAFSKMLICALGYDAVSETLGGPDWMINVQRLGQKIDLYSDKVGGVVATANITREEAALYALNMIQRPLVYYENAGVQITGANGLDIKVGGSGAKPQLNEARTNRYNNIAQNESNEVGVFNTALNRWEGAYIIEFAEQYYSDLIKDERGNAQTDKFERPSHKWTYKGKEIGSYSKLQTKLYTDAVTLGTIYADLGLTGDTWVTVGADAPAGNWDPISLYFIDGLQQWDLNGACLKLTKDSTVKVGGKGTDTYVYEDNGVVRICESNWYVGDVAGVYAATSTKAAYIDIAGRGIDDTKNGQGRFSNAAWAAAVAQALFTSGTKETTGYNVDDVVIYTASWKGNDNGYTDAPSIQTVKPAEKLDGELNSFVTLGTEGVLKLAGTGSVTIGGKKYSYSSKVAGTPDGTFLRSGVKLTIVLDNQGNVIDVSDYGVQNYAVVVKKGVAGSFGTDSVVDLLLTDGTTTGAVTLSVDDHKNNGVDIYYGAIGGTKVKVGDIVTYSIGANGNYSLDFKSAAAAYVNTIRNQEIITNGSANLYNFGGNPFAAGIFSKANGKTVFLVKDNSGNYKAYTGIKEVPTIYGDGSGNTFLCNSYGIVGKDSAAKVVYVDLGDNYGSMKNTETIFVHVSNSVGKSVNSSGDTYYEFDAYVDGEKTTIKVNSTDGEDMVKEFPNGGYAMYTSMTVNKRDIVTLGGRRIAHYGSTQEKNGVIGIGGTWYSYAKAVKVFYINDNDEITASSIKGIPTDNTTELWFNVDNGDEVIYIFWTKSTVTAFSSSAATATGAMPVATVARINAAFNTQDKVLLRNGDYDLSDGTAYNPTSSYLIIPEGKTLIVQGELTIDDAYIEGAVNAQSIVVDDSVLGGVVVDGGTLYATNNIIETGDGDIHLQNGGQIVTENVDGNPNVVDGATLTIAAGNFRMEGSLLLLGHIKMTDSKASLNIGRVFATTLAKLILEDLSIPKSGAGLAKVYVASANQAGTPNLDAVAGTIKTQTFVVDNNLTIAGANLTTSDTVLYSGVTLSITGGESHLGDIDGDGSVVASAAADVDGTVISEDVTTDGVDAEAGSDDLVVAWTYAPVSDKTVEDAAMAATFELAKNAPKVTLSDGSLADVTITNAKAFASAYNDELSDMAYLTAGDTVTFTLMIASSKVALIDDDGIIVLSPANYDYDPTEVVVVNDGKSVTIPVTYKFGR